MSGRTVLDQAWIALHTNGRLRMASGAERMLWLSTVMEVGNGDGVALHFGDAAGDDFSSRAEYLAAVGVTEGELAELFRRKLLVESKDGSIGIPPEFDLIRQRRQRPTPAVRRFVPRVVRGGRA